MLPYYISVGNPYKIDIIKDTFYSEKRNVYSG